MRRLLLQSAVFVRAARKLVKKNSEIAASLQAMLEALAEDAFQPALKTHKLKGELAGSWACSAGYDLRIVFEFVQHEGSEAIQLLTVGTHDEVY
jgi:addiction module RelE/StbE family toxin